MKFKIFVTLKPSVLDPQGEAIKSVALNKGINNISEVRQGKFFEVDIAEENQIQAEEKIKQICNELLCNSVIENFKYELA